MPYTSFNALQKVFILIPLHLCSYLQEKCDHLSLAIGWYCWLGLAKTVLLGTCCYLVCSSTKLVVDRLSVVHQPCRDGMPRLHLGSCSVSHVILPNTIVPGPLHCCLASVLCMIIVDDCNTGSAWLVRAVICFGLVIANAPLSILPQISCLFGWV